MTTSSRFRIFAAIPLLMVLLAGCAQLLESKVPERQRQAMDTFVAKAEESGVVGAFLLMRTPEGEYTASYGTTERGQSIEPAADTVFRIGSNTKTMTGTVILQLVEEGKLQLNDPVSKYHSNVPNGDKITIEMLLDMHSGLFDYTTDPKFQAEVEENPERAWTREELLEISFRQEPLFAPGAKYSYSNTNTVLLAVIAQKVTGSAIDQLITERITTPLGLSQTKLPAITDAGLATPFTHGYTYSGAKQDSLDDVTFVNPSYTSAAGAAVSTASELATWVEELTSGTLLGQEMQQERMDSVVPIPGDTKAESRGYGLGLAKLEGLYGHNGLIPGYNSYMGSDPDKGVTVVMWVNVAPDAEGGSIIDRLAAEVVPILLQP